MQSRVSLAHSWFPRYKRLKWDTYFTLSKDLQRSFATSTSLYKILVVYTNLSENSLIGEAAKVMKDKDVLSVIVTNKNSNLCMTSQLKNSNLCMINSCIL